MTITKQLASAAAALSLALGAGVAVTHGSEATQDSVAASYYAEIKCAKMTLAGHGDGTYIYGKGSGRTKAAAEKAAWNNVQSKVPRGYKAKHCRYTFSGSGSSSRF